MYQSIEIEEELLSLPIYEKKNILNWNSITQLTLMSKVFAASDLKCVDSFAVKPKNQPLFLFAVNLSGIYFQFRSLWNSKQLKSPLQKKSFTQNCPHLYMHKCLVALRFWVKHFDWKGQLFENPNNHWLVDLLLFTLFAMVNIFQNDSSNCRITMFKAYNVHLGYVFICLIF